MKYVKLGDLLVKSGAIAQGQLDEALSVSYTHLRAHETSV